MARLHLLPHNATALEKALSESLDRMEVLQPGVVELRGFKYTPLPDMLPFLIREYGLEDVALYVPDFEQVIAEGIAFQRERGTLASVHRALNWISRDGTIEEMSPHLVKWWWFQLHLPEQVRDTSFVTDVIGLVNSVKPVRSTFARITAGYDVRGFRTNGNRLNGGGLLNSWSGVRRRDGEPVLSFRYTHLAPVFDNEIYDPDVTPTIHKLRHTYLSASAVPTEQKSQFPSALGTHLVDTGDPQQVPFNSAPFTNELFGVPSPLVQKDY